MATTAFQAALQALAELDRDLEQPEPIPEPWHEWIKASPFLDLESALAHLPAPDTRAHIALGVSVAWARQLELECPPAAFWKQATHSFWWAIASVTLHDWGLWANSRHPVSTVLEHLALVSRSFGGRNQDGTEPELPATALAFLRDLHKACEQVAQAAVFHPSQLAASLKPVNDCLRQFRELQRQADHQLLAVEEEKRRVSTAHSAVTRVIRRAVWGHPVPSLVVDFLDTVWRRYLYLIFLKHGMDSPPWTAALKLIEQLIWLAGEAVAEEVKAELERSYPSLRQALLEGVLQLHHEERDDDFFLDLDMLMAARARNAPEAGLPLGELAFDEDETDFVGGEAAREPSGQVLQLQAGDYVDLIRDGHSQRVRLLELERSHDLYIFADCLGNAALVCNRATLTNIASTDGLKMVPVVHPMQIPPVFLGRYFDAALDLGRGKIKLLAEKQKRDRANDMAEQLEEHRKREAEERAQRIAQAKQQVEHDKRMQDAMTRLSQLRPGALVYLRQEGHPRSCHLAMIDSQTNHYIFVDRQGQRIADVALSELAEHFINGEFEILESGSAIDNTLRDLVRERRDFLKEQGAE